MNYKACADLGNTSLKLCFFKGAKITAFLRLPYQEAPVAAFKRAAGWCRQRGVSEVLLCSVNPTAGKKLATMMEKYRIRMITLKRVFPPNMKSDYDITCLGMDRLANIIAARKKYHPKNILVISCGTALTLDIIEGPRHLGGFIAPGLHTLLSTLPEKTDLLPRVDAGKGAIQIGRTTEDAIESGCRLLWTGGAERMAEYVRQRRKKRYAIILAGGDAPALKKVFPEAIVDGGLTFDGIRLMAQANP